MGGFSIKDMIPPLDYFEACNENAEYGTWYLDNEYEGEDE